MNFYDTDQTDIDDDDIQSDNFVSFPSRFSCVISVTLLLSAVPVS